ncbi:BRO1 domain-containing protein BROX-like [Acanthaster planci]|uniref:BRO1 domain-containing protein BROX-like n=1 Tax=Acanthaster planci TaxID=133434 RepID=A0A8B7YW22_ACAPL|nr:BRO1 domain-containing protein BROX-like [Acanthaster planci]XP_022096684.1 BRO1 domain-containing protein BROX-like [Acanthaster planci]XP_022096685.1 BRO1 domain-containing protein BROX-like [Acanthaster planci]
MAHWFHRNPLKATVPLNFDLGRQASTSSARKLCSDIRVARAQLLDLLRDPSHDVVVVKKATEKYISYLEGFITAVEDSKTSPEQPQQQMGEDVGKMTLQDTDHAEAGRSSGESKLRNAVKITWTNSLGGKNIYQYDFIFEKINMLFNIALWLTKHAAKLASSSVEISEDEAKEVHRSLREAAGIFKHIQDNILHKLYETPGDGCDLDQRILSAYEIQCKAEAQEVTLARAIELKHTPSLVAALAIETSKLFASADDALKSLDEKLVMKWRKYFQFKSVFYESYAHCYNGNTLLAKDKGGQAVRSLKEGMALFHKAEDLAKEYAKTKGPGVVAKPQQHPFFLRLGPIVHRILEKTERENGMIYHEKVPEEVPEIESKMKFGLANPVEYEVPSKNPEWTAAVYKGFVVSSTDKKVDDKDDTVKPVKEVPVEQTDKHPGNTTGCTVS